VLYIGQKNTDGTYGAAVLFSSLTGDVYSRGFIGYFSASRPETVSTGTLSNTFLTASAVKVSDPFSKPQCEYISGVQVCCDEFHDYQVQEFYLAGKGFGGFYRSGTSIFSGGGYTDIFKSTIDVGLTATNLK